MIIAGIMAKKEGYISKDSYSLKRGLMVFLDAIPSLLLIVIVIGGILKGVFTATEGSAIAVVYSLVLSFIYRALKPKDLPRILLDSARMMVIVIFMIGVSSIMSWVMAFTNIPQIIANALLSITSSKIIILLIMNVILLVIGTFMDPTPAVLIFTPIFLPMAESFGMHPVQFGIMIVFNLCIGTITPPVGPILFTGCKVGGVTIEQVFRRLIPFFIVTAVILLLVTFLPELSLTLPRLLDLVK
jgi:tripartite ATP-independent transporter DctM subunit